MSSRVPMFSCTEDGLKRSSRRFRLDVVSVTRVMERRHLVRDVSFAVSPGDIVAIVGRNGAGKTTLLHLLAGRLSPDGGHVRLEWEGREVRGAEYRARVAFLPHDLFLYPDLTARENLSFFASLHGVLDASAEIESVLDRVGLARDADRPVRAYSRGMQQRAAVGRLLVIGAPLWILDEPATGLDASGRQWLWDTLLEHAKTGGAVILASHDPTEVGRLATRIVALKTGRVVLDTAGGPEGAHRAFEGIEGVA